MKKPNIFVIDDSKLMLSMIKQMIMKPINNNYQVSCYDSYIELIHELDLLKMCDVFIMDYDVPGINGIQFAEYLYFKNKNRPIIFVTAHQDNCLLNKMKGCSPNVKFDGRYIFRVSCLVPSGGVYSLTVRNSWSLKFNF